jgi:hypothetical protein
MGKKKDKKYNEIRLDEKGNFDDIAIYDLHLEDMTGKAWWLGYYKGDKRICFWISSKTKITVTLAEHGLNTEIILPTRKCST